MRRKSKFTEEDIDDLSSATSATSTSTGSATTTAKRDKKENLHKRVTRASMARSVSAEIADGPIIGDGASKKDYGTANGAATKKNDDVVNGSASTLNNQTAMVVEGWQPGLDARIDYSGHKEFGGALGVSAMMIGFPALMYYMWIGATYYDGHAPTPAEGQSFGDFFKHLGHLIYEGAYPHRKAWAIYWTFGIFEMACYCLLPGVWGHGKPLPHAGGKQLAYYCSGMWSMYVTFALAAVLHVTGLFPLYTILDEFGAIMSVAIIAGFLVSTTAYISALVRGAEHRMTGNHIYDFFMGAELNPRMFGILDFKMFFEVRIPWYILLLLSCATATRQYEKYGYVSGEVMFLILAHYLYANACSKGEELIISTWDMYFEKWGFMLIFWNLAGVPLTYCHCTLYLANHHPDEYHWNPIALILFTIFYLFVYWIWDTTNSQKNRFRAEETGKEVLRKTFPQLPWQAVKNPKVITTKDGKHKILADGWYGKARKIHYTCDAIFALSWGLICGFNSPFPWFYPTFFICMITHRAWRDIQKCRAKYGEAWTQYEKEVPYLLIPYVI